MKKSFKHKFKYSAKIFKIIILTVLVEYLLFCFKYCPSVNVQGHSFPIKVNKLTWSIAPERQFLSV